jgi:hypothetical protein
MAESAEDLRHRLLASMAAGGSRRSGEGSRDRSRNRSRDRSRAPSHREASRRRTRSRSRPRDPQEPGGRGEAPDRGRARSRSRGRRSRSRSRSFRLQRSVSRELYKEGNADKVDPDKIVELVSSQKDYMLELIAEHKAEVEAKLQTKQRKFGNKQIEKQFEINVNFKDLAEKILVKVKAGELNRAEKLLEQLIQDLEEHGEDLVIADTSPYGWLAVAKVRAATDLPKSLRKKLEQVNKDLAAQKGKKNGPDRRKFSSVQGASQEPVIRRGDRRLTPEEALFQAGRQVRQGTCSHCKKEYHYYKECPSFWQKVQESRAAKAKEDAGTN